ncbi:MAG: L,D-transpeptidase family protein [Hyphomicrobium sp.]
MRWTMQVGRTLISKVQLIYVLAFFALFAACSSAPDLIPAEQPLSKETLDLLGRKGMSPDKPIFVQIFKEESELELWKARDDGRFYHFKTYPICNWSGDLGPKLVKGDKQAPEGFYTISPTQMKPDSNYHVAFNLGFPNAFDRANNRSGDFLMIHGKCKSAGCYAMTDALAEEIYGLAREAFRGGQTSFEVHAYPFRMTADNLMRHKKNRWFNFWATLKQGYDYFEKYRVPPMIAVCERRYVIDVSLPAVGRLDPIGRCPPFQRLEIEPFNPSALDYKIAQQRIVVPGPKLREGNIASLSEVVASYETTAPINPSDAFQTKTLPAQFSPAAVTTTNQ